MFGYPIKKIGEKINKFSINRENRLIFSRIERAGYDYPEQGIRHSVEREIRGLRSKGRRLETRLVRSNRDKAGVLLRNEVLYREKMAAEKMAKIDALTGLENRRAFEEIMEKEIERSKRYDRPLVYMMVDIDHFKVVNDKEGYKKGDLVLKDLAQILKQNIRAGDTVARIGGEEFGIILPETNIAQAQKVGEKLLQAVQEGTQGKKYKSVTISGGYALFGDNETADKESLEKYADKALKDAKREGRNRMIPYQKIRKIDPEALRMHTKAHIERVIPTEMDAKNRAQLFRELLAEAEKEDSEKGAEDKTGTDG